MRENLPAQPPLVAAPFDHQHVRELEAIDTILVRLPEATAWVYDDLVAGLKNPSTGRTGMSAELVLRTLVVKQMTGFSYEQLVFHLGDSAAYRAFCKLGIGDPPPTLSTLKRNLKRVSAETLEAIHWQVLLVAHAECVEEARTVRFDCTVTETNIHEPSDSSLLNDCVRVLVRCMTYAKEFVSVPFRDSTLRAKRRDMEILNARTNKARVKPYRDLMKVTGITMRSAERVADALDSCEVASPTAYARSLGLAVELRHYASLARQVIAQTGRRIFLGDTVPAKEKIVSIFEPHTDIIIKDRRQTLYGHKLCLATGASGLVLDLRVEDGNPADSTLAVEMVKRQSDIFDRVPEQVAFDGGFASRDNLTELKELGVNDVAFSKKRGLEVEEMARSKRIYRSLRNFRAGIEAGISYLKRCFGMDRCTWRSLASFKAYCWASVLSANLLTLARRLL